MQADVLTLVKIAQHEAETNPDPTVRVLAGMVIRLAQGVKRES